MQQSTAIMSSRYPPNTYSNTPAYTPVRSGYAPSHDPRADRSAASGSYMPATQYRIDEYGRQQQQQQPRHALPHGGNVISPLQPGYQQRLPDRTIHPYQPSGQYRQDVNTSPDSPYAPAMTRGSSSGSYGTEGGSPQSHSSSEGPKE